MHDTPNITHILLGKPMSLFLLEMMIFQIVVEFFGNFSFDFARIKVNCLWQGSKCIPYLSWLISFGIDAQLFSMNILVSVCFTFRFCKLNSFFILSRDFFLYQCTCFHLCLDNVRYTPNLRYFSFSFVSLYIVFLFWKRMKNMIKSLQNKQTK